jgi:proteasome accessory factor B
VSRKIERLINLTIALLATKRYLTKSEIFRSVEGYEGSEETKERMFERDKDDLRNLGVAIEVGSFDPVFEDEAGYRIKPEKYSLDLGDISGVQIALLSLAAEAWRGAALDQPAHSALTKLRSVGVESDLDALPAIAPRFNSAHKDFQIITHAISKRARLTFSYISETLELQQRTIEPYAVATRDSFWYLAGKDIEKAQIRSFRLDRIDGDISISKNGQGYEIPDGFDLFANFEIRELAGVATVDVRKGKAQLLRNNALTITDMGEWDRITTSYFSSEIFIELVLWHGEDALIIGPNDLQSEIIARLNEIVALHV